jgi:hypothetical protein
VQGAQHPAHQPPRHQRRGQDGERERDEAGFQDVAPGRVTDGLRQLLGRHHPVADADGAARRQRRHRPGHPTDQQPAQPQQRHADQRDQPGREEGEARPQSAQPAPHVQPPARCSKATFMPESCVNVALLQPLDP